MSRLSYSPVERHAAGSPSTGSTACGSTAALECGSWSALDQHESVARSGRFAVAAVLALLGSGVGAALALRRTQRSVGVDGGVATPFEHHRVSEKMSLDLLGLAQAGAPSVPDTWVREHIGFFKHRTSGKCLDLTLDPLIHDNATAVLRKCDYSLEGDGQTWVVDITMGFVRSLRSNGLCLDVRGTPGWQDGSDIDVIPCEDTQDSDQRWKFDENGFIVNRLSGKCIGVRGTPDGVAELELAKCDFGNQDSPQTWAFVGTAQVAAERGAEMGRPSAALALEDVRRHKAKEAVGPESHPGGEPMLVLEDVLRASSPPVLLGGDFWRAERLLFRTMKPSWDEWPVLIELGEALAKAGPVQAALGGSALMNFMSNMLFAGMNFVEGFQRPHIVFNAGLSELDAGDFVPAKAGCGEGYDFMPFCRWPAPPFGETVGLITMQEYIVERYGAKLPNHTFFETLFTGGKVPSWEDEAGRDTAIELVSAGLAAARARGYVPMQVVIDWAYPRFAFDTEGLAALLRQNFGFSGAEGTSYVEPGPNGVVALERLMEKYNTQTDVLGLLLTETVLSSHLRYDSTEKVFVVDMMDLAQYKPLPGYAKLGGRALLQERGGRLCTMQLEYEGISYTEFESPSSAQDFAEKSKLSGWRFAEKAIIASLMAKTQLLMHVKTIHLELAPILQAATVDVFSQNPSHPLRRLLSPFISRNIQATKSNLRLWFEFRFGEFGLAPLPMEEQLRLLHETIENSPLNLAMLDMDHFAKARNMEQFTGTDANDGGWTWRWHQRAVKVQNKLDGLVSCWLEQHYNGDENNLRNDAFAVAWWNLLREKMPALRVAEAESKGWIQDTTPTTTAPPARKMQRVATTPRPEDGPAGAPAADASTSPQFFSVMSLHPQLLPTAQPALDTALVEPDIPQGPNLWRRLGISVQRLDVPEAPGLSFGSLRNVLRTLMLWLSWIHEDVGHNFAAFLYNPVHTPFFVPSDGVGIPVVPYVFTATAYRSFIFLERPSVTDVAPEHWFDQKTCHSAMFFMKVCSQPKDDKSCYLNFQAGMKGLGSQDDFADCDAKGFYSCVDHVETSASS